MKKLMLIAAACVALASCVKNEVEPIVNDAPISFQAVQGLESTRAAYPNDHFVASALLLQSGEAWAADKATAQNFFLNQEVTNHGDVDTDGIDEWSTATPYYWPEQGSLTFFAYYPKTVAAGEVSADRTAYTFAGYNDDTYKNIDFLVADIATDKNGTDVPAVFRHKMTKIALDMKVETEQVGRKITLQKVELNNVANVATYTQPTDASADDWSAWGAQTNDYTLYDAAALVLSATAQEVALDKYIYIPQNLADDATLKITYNVETTIGGVTSTEKVVVENTFDKIHDNTGATKAAVWAKNQFVTYTITIADAKQIYWEPSIIEWDTTHNDGITI